MPKFDAKRLAKTVAGDPPVLSVSIVVGNGTNPVALPGSSVRDGLVSVIQDSSGSSWTDITATAELEPHGSIDPGVDVGVDKLWVTWYQFG
jgi:hypothetical protein